MDALGNLLEVEISVIPKDESHECDQELRQRRVHVHEELGFDVLRGEFSKVDLIKAGNAKI